MDEDTASRFVASLVKSIQALCNGYIEFSTSIEVIGHIHLNIDRNCKFNYVLSEEVNKSVSEGSTIFSSHSYHSHPPSSLVPVKASSSVESAKGTHRKSQSVPSVHQGDTAAVTSLQKEVTVSHKDTQKINDYTPQTSLSDRLSESGDSSHSGKFSLNLTYESSSAQSGRLPQTSSTGTPNSAHSKLTSHNQDPLDRRRKAQTEVQTRRTVEPSPKRTRANDSGLGTQDSGFEVIEIKEEPSLEEPCVFFADSNSQIPMGQGDLSSGASRLSGWKKDTITNDLNQTPDFSKSVMESLERVGQLEGASLINPVDAQIQLQQQPLQQDQPFPVMLHANSAAQASSVALPGTSNQQGSAPSTSGGPEAEPVTTFITVPSKIVKVLNSKIPATQQFRALIFNEPPEQVEREEHMRLTEHHVMQRLPPTPNKKYPSKKCKVCHLRSKFSPIFRKNPKESSYHCPTCPSKPALCTHPCFAIYHSKQNFWEVGDDEAAPAPALQQVRDDGSGKHEATFSDSKHLYVSDSGGGGSDGNSLGDGGIGAAVNAGGIGGSSSGGRSGVSSAVTCDSNLPPPLQRARGIHDAGGRDAAGFSSARHTLVPEFGSSGNGLGDGNAIGVMNVNAFGSFNSRFGVNSVLHSEQLQLEEHKRLTEHHVMQRLPPTPNKKYPSKKCKVCYLRSKYSFSFRKNPKESSYHCPSCPSKPTLCTHPCFAIYHSKRKFWEVDEEEMSTALRQGRDDGRGQDGAAFSGTGHLYVPDCGSGNDLGEGSAGMTAGFSGSFDVNSGRSEMYGSLFNNSGDGSGVDANITGNGNDLCVPVKSEVCVQDDCIQIPQYGESTYGPGDS